MLNKKDIKKVYAKKYREDIKKGIRVKVYKTNLKTKKEKNLRVKIDNINKKIEDLRKLLFFCDSENEIKNLKIMIRKEEKKQGLKNE